jgi:hypothetical protein
MIVEQRDQRFSPRNCFEQSKVHCKLPLYLYAVDLDSDPDTVLLLCSTYPTTEKANRPHVKRSGGRIVRHFMWLEFKALPSLIDSIEQKKQPNSEEYFDVGASLKKHEWPVELEPTRPFAAIHGILPSRFTLFGLHVVSAIDPEHRTLSNEELAELLHIDVRERGQGARRLALYAQDLMRLCQVWPERQVHCPNISRKWHPQVTDDNQPKEEPAPTGWEGILLPEPILEPTKKRKRQRK